MPELRALLEGQIPSVQLPAAGQLGFSNGACGGDVTLPGRVAPPRPLPADQELLLHPGPVTVAPPCPHQEGWACLGAPCLPPRSGA